MIKLFQGKSPLAGWLFPAGSAAAGMAADQQQLVQETTLFGLALPDIGILFGILGTVVISTVTILRYLRDRNKDD